MPRSPSLTLAPRPALLAPVLTLVLTSVIALSSAGCLTRVPGAQLPTGRAPDFTLSDFEGHRVTLSDGLHQGPTVVVFYRGHW